jgi:hypothetical protein
MKVTSAIGSAMFLCMMASAPARADVVGEPAGMRETAYAVTGSELGMAGMFALHFGARVSSDGLPVTLETFGVLGLGVGAGLAAHYGDWDPRVPQAIHGAGWVGLDLFLLGAMIDGRDQAWGMRAGRFAYSLGAVGAVGGALLGSRITDGTGSGVWLAGPSIGFVGGGLVLGSVLVIGGGVDGDHALGQFATGAVIGGLLGTGVAGYFAFKDPGRSTLLPTGRPAVDVGGGRMIFSYGGAF